MRNKYLIKIIGRLFHLNGYLVNVKWRYDRRSGNCNLSNSKLLPAKKKIETSTGFEPMAFALALQCPNQVNYEDPYIGSRPNKQHQRKVVNFLTLFFYYYFSTSVHLLYQPLRLI